MPGKNNYHYGESTEDSAATYCDQRVGWLLAESEEYTTSDKEKFVEDPDACKHCLAAVKDEGAG